MFTIKPKENWKFVKFDNYNRVTIDDDRYTFQSFINSGQYIIHDVTTIVDTKNTYTRNSYYVWYEPKGE